MVSSDDFPINQDTNNEYKFTVENVDQLDQNPFVKTDKFLDKYEITFKISVDTLTKKIDYLITTTADEEKEYNLTFKVSGQKEFQLSKKYHFSSSKPINSQFDITFEDLCKSDYVLYNSTTISFIFGDPDSDFDGLTDFFSSTNTGEYKGVNTVSYDSSYNSTSTAATTAATYSSKDETGFVGLQNQGATCYMNSLLQSLFHLPAFRKIVYEMPTSGTEDEKKSIPLNLQRLFCEMQLGNEACSTKALTTSFGWGSTETFMQHDIEEFNRVLIDNLETKLKGTPLQSSIADLFKGKYRNYIRCRNVPFTSSREEDFYDLQMVVRGCPNLRESFKQYTASDELVGDNQYEAEGYGKQDADMGIEFVKFPTVLQLHLNRFEYDYNYDRMTKINDKFEFPEEIDLSEFLAKDADKSKSSVYTLFGVLVHYGSASFGHYYAFLRPSTDKQWYQFNDSRVTKVDKDKAIEDNFGSDDTSSSYSYNYYYGYGTGKSYSAYILVYVRKEEANNVFQPIPDDAVPQHLKEYMNRPKPQEISYYNSLDVTVMTEETFAQGTVEVKKIFTKLDNEKKFQISKDSTNAELYKRVSEELKIDVEQIRLWRLKSYYNTPYEIVNNNDEKLDTYYYSYTYDVYCQIKPKEEPLVIPTDDILVFTKFFFPNDEFKLQFVKEVQIRKDATLKELSDVVNKLVGFPEGTELKCFTEAIDQKAALNEDMNSKLDEILLSTGSVVIFQLLNEDEHIEPTLLKKKTPSDFAISNDEKNKESEKAETANKEVKIDDGLPIFLYSDSKSDFGPLTVAKYFINHTEILEFILCDFNDTTRVIGKIQFPTDVLFEDLYLYIAKISETKYDPENDSMYLFKADSDDGNKPSCDFIDLSYYKTPKTILYKSYQDIKKLFFTVVEGVPLANSSNYSTKRIVYSENGFDLTFDRPIFFEKSITKIQDLVDSLIERKIILPNDSYVYLKIYRNDIEDLFKPEDELLYSSYYLRIQPKTVDFAKAIIIARVTIDRINQYSHFNATHLSFFYELPEDKTRDEIMKDIQEKCKYSDKEFAKLRFQYKASDAYQPAVLPREGELQTILKPLSTLYLIERSQSNRMSASHSNDSVKIYN